MKNLIMWTLLAVSTLLALYAVYLSSSPLTRVPKFVIGRDGSAAEIVFSVNEHGDPEITMVDKRGRRGIRMLVDSTGSLIVLNGRDEGAVAIGADRKGGHVSITDGSARGQGIKDYRGLILGASRRIGASIELDSWTDSTSLRYETRMSEHGLWSHVQEGYTDSPYYALYVNPARQELTLGHSPMTQYGTKPYFSVETGANQRSTMTLFGSADSDTELQLRSGRRISR